MSETAASECRCAPDHAMGFTFHQPPCQYVPATPDAGDASEGLSDHEYGGLPWDGNEPKMRAALNALVASREAAAATRARAEALREAARDLPGLDMIRTHGDAANWLRARADSLADTPARTIPTTATVRDGIKARTAADDRVALNRALNRDVP